MSHSILVRQYLSLLDQNIVNSTLLFSVMISIASVVKVLLSFSMIQLGYESGRTSSD